MKQFQIQLDETVYKWLAHIAEVTGQTIEDVISNGIYHQIANLDESVTKAFTYCE